MKKGQEKCRVPLKGNLLCKKSHAKEGRKGKLQGYHKRSYVRFI